jgi:hypothetical protein
MLFVAGNAYKAIAIDAGREALKTFSIRCQDDMAVGAGTGPGTAGGTSGGLDVHCNDKIIDKL